MICQERDQDLLLMAHGELGLLARARTERHVRNCPRCRKRMGEFATISAAFAQTLAPGDGPRPIGPAPAVRIPTGSSLLLVLALLTVIAVSLFIAIRSVAPPGELAIPSKSTSAKPGVRHGTPGCLPGLVSDKCR